MMRNGAVWFLAFLLLGGAIGVGNADAEPLDQQRMVLPFDHDWRFLKSDATGAEKPAFDDTSWRGLNVPHDWSIEGPFDQKNPTGGAGAFLPAGVGWYRKRFILPENLAGRRVFVRFDGVMANSDVWINGVHLGHRPYGYVSFQYDLTGHLNFGDARSNVLAVRVDDARQPASRWYAGAGVYRHVRLVVTDPVHLEHWGTFVTTPKVDDQRATVPLGAWERRLRILKQLGVNAIRTAHNPPAPEFLDLCDRMGFLVMDELFDCWTVGKNKYDYHLYFNEWSKTDARDTIRRDRNHPSVILYSAGNEIHDTPKPELAKRILRGLIDVIHANDPTRPVTQALFRPNVSHDYDDGLADMLDVVGQNYRENEILAAHRQKPTRKIIGTENGMTLAAWLALRDNPPYAGQFLWAGIDYLGESRHWPVIDNNQGLLDRTDTPKPIAFQRQSWWSDEPMVYATRRVARTDAAIIDPGYGNDPLRRPQVLFSDWTPHNLGAHEETVEVYSNCEQAELVLNGKSLGSKPRPTDDAPRVWQVPFEAGTLKAIGSNAGHAAATHELRTTGKPAKVLLSTGHDRLTPNWDDVSYVTATIADANGIPVPDGHDEIAFAIAGPGIIAAVDSADGASHEPFQATQRRAYQGRCVAILRATAGTGRITLTATAPGLANGSIKVETREK